MSAQRNPRRTGRGRLIGAILAAGLALAACGSPGETTSVTSEGTLSPTVAGFPVTVDNCGRQVTFDRPPARAVSLDQIATEVMLGFGLEKSMVGTSYLTNPILPSLATAYQSVPVLAPKYPSTEVLLAASPDVVIGNLDTYTFDPKAGRDRDGLEAKGIKTYVLQCAGETASFDLIFTRYRELGRIFGVPDKADQITSGYQAAIAATTAKVAGVPPVKTFFYERGENAPTTFSGVGIFNSTLVAAGGANVFADNTSTTPPVVSWEEVANRSPDTIIIIDFAGDKTVDQKQAFLAGFPPIAQVPAVKNNRYVVSKFIDFTTGARIQETVARLAADLHPERF